MSERRNHILDKHLLRNKLHAMRHDIIVESISLCYFCLLQYMRAILIEHLPSEVDRNLAANQAPEKAPYN